MTLMFAAMAEIFVLSLEDRDVIVEIAFFWWQDSSDDLVQGPHFSGNRSILAVYSQESLNLWTLISLSIWGALPTIMRLCVCC